MNRRTRIGESGLMKYLSCLALVFVALSFLPVCSSGQEEPAGPIPIRLKYLFGIDGMSSGTPFSWVDRIVVDGTNGEIYFLDNNNKRIVVTDTDGVYLYQIRYEEQGIKMPLDIAVDPESGDIFVAESKRIVILNYRGVYKREIDLSSLPEGETIAVQSITLRLKEEGLIYIGDGGNGRVLVITPDGNLVKQFGKKEGVGSNVRSIHVDDREITFLDPATFSVYHFTKEGRFLAKFGKVSSLLGGFSMATAMDVDDEKRRIFVVDTNRMMVIAFDWEGTPLYEFGGPRMFRWPRALAVGRGGRIYVADNTGVIRVFEVVEEGTP